MEIILEGGFILTTIGLILASVMIYFASRELSLTRKTRTIEYVTNQFDKLTKIGARKELRKVGDRDIRSYVKEHPGTAQTFLEYVYAFNRIGAGIYKKALSEDVVFQIWTPRWFIEMWKKFKSWIKQERERRGEAARGAYVYFKWLAEEKCPEVEKKYPEYKWE